MPDSSQVTAVDEPKDFGEGDEALVKRWLTEISVGTKEFQAAPRDWFKTGDKIVKRYRDERDDELSADSQQRRDAKFNILWANVQLLQPALYARTPSPEVVRRFKERDPVARAAATLLERAISYTLDTQDFDDVMNSVVQDRLLPGRGTAWVRYVPTMRSVTPQVPVQPGEVYDEKFDGLGNLASSKLRYRDDDGGAYDEDKVLRGEDGNPYVDGDPYDEVADEKVAIDYVFWKDFGHTTARNWGEVRAVWRIAYMTRTQLRERFGKEIGNAVPLDYTPKNVSSTDEIGTPSNETFKKATIYEIWDKETKKAYWISKKYEHGPLDTQDDPLGLEGFFPCPKPLYSTTTTDSMVPVPDYVEYFDQATELDTLTSRMQRLMRALKLSGLYNSTVKESLQQMLDSPENNLIPVDGWAMFAEQGGINGNIEWLPIKEIAAVLLSVAEAREKVKQDLYEVTGLSDIMRGSTKASETMGAQELKSRYGSLRLKTSVAEVQRFARDLLRITGEIISEQFAPETIRDIAGMELPTRADIEQAKAAIAEVEAREEKIKKLPPEQQQQAAQIPTPDKAEMDNLRDIASDVAFEDAIALLEDQGIRTFRLDIETDSTIAVDEAEGRQDRIEFLGASANFMKIAAELGAAVPEYIPVLSEMLMFGIRGFKVGRQLEDTFEDATTAIQRRMAQQADEPQEDPAAVLARQEMELKAREQQADEKIGQAKVQLEARGLDIDALDDKTGHEIEREKLRSGKDMGEQQLSQDAMAKAMDYAQKAVHEAEERQERA